MNIEVCNGSYEVDLKRIFSRVVIFDENNDLYVLNNNNYYLFPGCEEKNDDECSISNCLINNLGIMPDVNYYCSIKYYHLIKENDCDNSKIYTNYLDVTILYLAKINSSELMINNESIKKIKYDDLFNNVKKSKDETYKEEMITLLKSLPTYLKKNEDVKIKKKGL